MTASPILRIVLVGAESTGKTTLAKQLALRYQTAWVPEYGRELWEQRGGELRFADMVDIARTQVQREQGSAASANGLLVCDTTPLTTLLYSEVMFGEVAEELQELARRPYALTLLCAPDFAFVQDGTRRDEPFRSSQHRWYIDALRACGTDYTLLEGSLAQRVESALSLVRASVLRTQAQGS